MSFFSQLLPSNNSTLIYYLVYWMPYKQLIRLRYKTKANKSKAKELASTTENEDTTTQGAEQNNPPTQNPTPTRHN